MEEIDIINRYFQKDIIWEPTDKWHLYTYNKIQTFIKDVSSDFLTNKKIVILNAGSAGEEYGLIEHVHIHVDIVDTKIKDKQNFIVSNIETVELNEKVDMVLCVGSVLNYTDPVRAIKNFSKLLKTGGYLLIEFEKSTSLEFIFHKSFNEQVAIIHTFYGSHEEKLKVFSERYIKSIIRYNKFILMRTERFHIASPLIFRLVKQANFAAKFSYLDIFFKYINPLNYFSSNVIYFCQKA